MQHVVVAICHSCDDRCNHPYLVSRHPPGQEFFIDAGPDSDVPHRVMFGTVQQGTTIKRTTFCTLKVGFKSGKLYVYVAAWFLRGNGVPFLTSVSALRPIGCSNRTMNPSGDGRVNRNCRGLCRTLLLMPRQ